MLDNTNIEELADVAECNDKILKIFDDFEDANEYKRKNSLDGVVVELPLKLLVGQLKDRELFPESNKRAKEFLSKVTKSDL